MMYLIATREHIEYERSELVSEIEGLLLVQIDIYVLDLGAVSVAD